MGISPFNHKLKFIEHCNHVTIQTYCIYTLRYIRIRSIQLTHNIIYSFQQAKQSVENDTEAGFMSDYVRESMWRLPTIFEKLNKPEKWVFLVVSDPGNKSVTCNVQTPSNTQTYSACNHCDKPCILVLSSSQCTATQKSIIKNLFGHKIHNPAYLDLQ